MRNLYLLLTLFSAIHVSAQNPVIIKTVGSTVLEPKNKDQEIWQNNEWNGKFFYQGTGTPLKLCVTDGTSAGTQLIKDITADYFQFTIPAQNFIYIITERSSGSYPNLLNNVEIWKSDGTSAGTTLVKALPPYNPFNFSSFHRWTSDKNLKRNFSVVGDVMYFVAWDATNGSELWRTDGTDAGTYMVKDIRPGTANSNASSFCAVGNEVYFFAASVGLEQKLWKTDGTAAGTVQVTVTEPFFATPYVGKVGSKMIFFANNTVHGTEPWVSDGTPAGTYMLADINPGSGGSSPSTEQNLHLRFNDKYCFFIANKTSGGKSLWRTDGTPAGTIQLTPDGLITEDNFSGGAYSDINNNVLYWIGGNQKLYRSDGTVAGTFRVTAALSNALYMKIYKNAAWFHARNSDNVSNGEPFRSDGTLANTKRFEVQPGETPSYPYGFFVTNNKLYFFSDSYAGRNLYQFNGDMTFNGSVAGGRWRDNGNWNSLLTPGITDTVYLNPGATVNIDGASAYAGTLIMQAGSAINLGAATDSLYINNELNGTSAGGNGILSLRNFTGDTARITSAFTAGNLTADGLVSIKGNILVTNKLHLTANSRIAINNANIVLSGAASTITNGPNGYIVTNGTGSLAIENIGSAGRTGSVLFPVGTQTNYNPVTFSNTGTADVFNVRVTPGISNRYTGEAATGSTYTGGAVNATWFINEGTAGGSNASIDFQWDASQEQAGFDRSQSRVGHYTGGTWQLGAAGAAIGSNPYSWSSSGFTSFSPFGVFNSNAILPVRNIYINAFKSTNGNRISWDIAASDVSQLLLESSLNGQAFTTLQSQAFSEQGTYNDATTNQKTFYRLQLKMADGRSLYSRVVWVNKKEAPIQVYPTIFNNQITVNQPSNSKSVLVIANSASAVVLTRVLEAGSTEVNVSALPKGSYFFQVKKMDGTSLNSGLLQKL